MPTTFTTEQLEIITKEVKAFINDNNRRPNCLDYDFIYQNLKIDFKVFGTKTTQALKKFINSNKFVSFTHLINKELSN